MASHSGCQCEYVPAQKRSHDSPHVHDARAMSSDSIQRQRLHDLACLLRQLDPCPDTEAEEAVASAPLSKDEAARQRLLDALAFVAATEKTADQVAAVGMEEHPQHGVVRFSIATNGTVRQLAIDGVKDVVERVRERQSGKYASRHYVRSRSFLTIPSGRG